MFVNITVPRSTMRLAGQTMDGIVVGKAVLARL